MTPTRFDIFFPDWGILRRSIDAFRLLFRDTWVPLTGGYAQKVRSDVYFKIPLICTNNSLYRQISVSTTNED